MKRVIKADAMQGQQGTQALPLELADVTADAKRLLATSRAQAESMISQALAEASAIREQARGDGFAEGLLQGRQEGFSQAQQAARQQVSEKLSDESERLVAIAAKVIGEIASARQATLQEAKDHMVEFAISLASKIVGQVAATDINAARANLAKVLELADGEAAITVKVNSSQLRRLQEELPELVKALRVRGQVELSGDDEVPMGGARVLGQLGEIDATIETQWNNVVEALLGPAASRFRLAQP